MAHEVDADGFRVRVCEPHHLHKAMQREGLVGSSRDTPRNQTQETALLASVSPGARRRVLKAEARA
eukprot:1485111-Rhodomonas_salina.1